VFYSFDRPEGESETLRVKRTRLILHARVKKFRLWLGPLLGILIITFVVLSLIAVGSYSRVSDWLRASLIALPLIIVFIMSYYLIKLEDFRQELGQAQIEAAYGEAVDAAKSTRVSDVEPLLDLNRELLRGYHNISTGQARQSFRMAQLAMVAGGILLIAGGAVALSQHVTADKATVAALTAIGSAIAGYISATFLRSYEISAQQAERYFREPLVGGYLLAAERVARGIPDGNDDQKTEVLTKVVQGILDAAIGAAQSEPSQRR
jgi:hypothetical protein